MRSGTPGVASPMILSVQTLGWTIAIFATMPVGCLHSSIPALSKTRVVSPSAVTTTPEYFTNCHLPVIALLEEGPRTQNHFSVVLAASPSTVWLIDGTTGAVVPLTAGSFNEQWRGYLLVNRGSQAWLRWTSVLAILGGCATTAHAVVCFWRHKKPIPAK